MRCVRNMFAFNGPHYLLDGTSEQELKCKLPSIAASSSSLHITVSAAHLILHCMRKVVVGISHLLQIQKKYKRLVYTMFTLWNKPPLRTLALQPGKCDAALHRVKKVVPSRIVASPSYTISTPHKPQPSPISPLFTSAQDATCTPAATSKQ